jgi:uncharacterized OB-fold protein
VRTGTVIAATAIRAAPDGFEPGYVIALVDVGGCRELRRLDDVTEPPLAGSIVRLGRGDRQVSSGSVVSGADAAH